MYLIVYGMRIIALAVSKRDAMNLYHSILRDKEKFAVKHVVALSVIDAPNMEPMDNLSQLDEITMEVI